MAPEGDPETRVQGYSIIWEVVPGNIGRRVGEVITKEKAVNKSLLSNKSH